MTIVTVTTEHKVFRYCDLTFSICWILNGNNSHTSTPAFAIMSQGQYQPTVATTTGNILINPAHNHPSPSKYQKGNVTVSYQQFLTTYLDHNIINFNLSSYLLLCLLSPSLKLSFVDLNVSCTRGIFVLSYIIPIYKSLLSLQTSQL